ncbi:MAG: hypothetical protein K2G88_06735 [Oscillospiraceae bacterium]|nr:hypothetical protein [Oscillospiraceae bacterium]
MKKIMLLTLLTSVLLSCTACKKNQENPETIPETTAIIETTTTQSEMTTNTNINTNLKLETKSTTTTNSNSESNANSTTSSTSVTSLLSCTAPIIKSIESTEVTESPLQLEMQEALQIALDEEERQAIQNVQTETEKLMYYKNPTLDFDKNNFQNLGIKNFGLSIPSSSHGSNIHKYFFETKSMSGRNLLQMQKMANDFANVEMNIDKINSSAETLEDSEYLIYNSDSLYLKYQNTGECLAYRPDMIQEFTGEEISENWNPLANSINLGEVTGYTEKNYILDGEYTCLSDIYTFLYDYFEQAYQNGWISCTLGWTSCTLGWIHECELLEFSNGIQGFYITVQLFYSETNIEIDNTAKSAFLNEEQQIHPQEIKILMFRPDSIAYIQLPTILTQKPDTIETLDSTYCTLNEACAVLSDYLSQDYVYPVENMEINYQTLFFYQDNQYAGMVQVPMYHFVIANPDSNIPYQTIYADIALDTKQLYISY